MAGISIMGLRKQFDATAAVDDLTLHVAAGELIALLGPSGCGKTTTLRMVAGFDAPSAGEIRVGDRLLSSPTMVVPPEQRRMSMIFQTYAVWPHLTVFENVAFGLRLRGMKRADIERKVRQMLAVVRLEKLGDRYPAQLSGGQQQRVSLARALVVEPEILLLDEPLSNLDAHLREEMRFEIRRLHDEFGITSLYVTHDQAEAMVAADRIVVMHRGHIEQAGTAEDLYDRPQTEFVASFIGSNNVLRCRHAQGQTWLGAAPLGVEAGTAPHADTDNAIVAIRPHDIALHPWQARPADTANVVAGEIRRATFLGECRDYLVGLAESDIVLRVSAQPSARYEAGQRTWVRLPAQCCRYLQP